MNPVLLFVSFIGIVTLMVIVWPVGLLVPSSKPKRVIKEETVVQEQVTVNADFGKDLRSVDIDDL